MADSQACYRKLRHYKYQLVNDYTLTIDLKQENDIETPFIKLTTAGQLTMKKRYAWDGPSGPTIDTRSFMRGSLVHDALYQLMREECLDYKVHRAYADELLRELCLEDGMFRVWAWCVYQAVQLFGEIAARPRKGSPDEIICVP